MERPEIAMLSEFLMSDLIHRNTDSLCTIDVTKNLSFFLGRCILLTICCI